MKTLALAGIATLAVFCGYQMLAQGAIQYAPKTQHVIVIHDPSGHFALQKQSKDLPQGDSTKLLAHRD